MLKVSAAATGSPAILAAAKDLLQPLSSPHAPGEPWFSPGKRTELVMSDLNTEATAAPVDAATPSTEIAITLKNGAGVVTVDTSMLPDAVYREALMQGLKVIAERAMSKITKEAYPVEAERKAAIKAKAEANIAEMYAGTIKITGAVTVKKASGAVMTEAMRLARNLVKDAMKANKIKISHVKASEITALAKKLIESDPSIITTAEDNLKAREATPVKLDIAKLVHVDPKLVAADEAKKAAKKAEKDGQLSKTQAGKVVPRAKGSKPAAATAH